MPTTLPMSRISCWLPMSRLKCGGPESTESNRIVRQLIHQPHFPDGLALSDDRQSIEVRRRGELILNSPSVPVILRFSAMSRTTEISALCGVIKQARSHDATFTSFVENTVNGRAGVQLGVRRDHSQCDQIMDGGPVSLSVSVAQAGLYTGAPIDSCAETLRIAQLLEPRLPRAGS